MEIYELGDFPLSTGVTLPNAKLAYNTHGNLSATKDNAIVFESFLGAPLEALETWIGKDRPLDPDKYFIIMPGPFGGGSSSSPSNTPPPFDRGAFPPVNIVDDVIAQQRLVTEIFGIQELQLVVGWSTGGLRSYEWAIRFPHMVKRMASIAGAPRPPSWTRLWLRAVVEEPIRSDPAWNNGFYLDRQAVQAGARRQGLGTALTAPPRHFFREELWRAAGFASLDDFISRFWEAFWLATDPNDVLAQARQARAADPSAGGDLAAALGQIKAKTFVAAFTGDNLFPPEECKLDADKITHSEFREISSAWGHMATYALSEQDRQAVDNVLQEVLAD
jgi:homoserine O-acetyltransferase/O-succinyltransferase